MSWQDDPDWERFRRSLGPIERGVPQQIPPWRLAGLGLLQIVAVIGTALVSLPLISLLVFALEPSLGDSARPFALGGAVLIWALLSMSSLAVLVRRASGGVLSLPLSDWVFAAVLYVALAAWVINLGEWLNGKAGLIEIDLLSRSATAWPAAVVAVSLAMAGTSASGSRLRRGLWLAAAGVLVLLSLESASSVIGAVGDGHVSAAGIGVGIAAVVQLVVLAIWLIARWPWAGVSLARRSGPTR
jgi:hypothetical protein